MTATIRFAALGDSLTEGVGAPGSDGWRGWAALLAPSLAAAPDGPSTATSPPAARSVWI